MINNSSNNTVEEIKNELKSQTGELKEIKEILILLDSHGIVKLHKNKFYLIIYNISLGILFAIGTVLWLFLISWFTFLFLKDSTIIKDIIDNQLKMRYIDIKNIRKIWTGSELNSSQP